jgi:homocysteine S-methyltransferase
MRQAETPEQSRAEGIAIAREMCAQVRGMVQGVQLSAPFGRYDMAVQVAEALGER